MRIVKYAQSLLASWQQMKIHFFSNLIYVFLMEKEVWNLLGAKKMLAEQTIPVGSAMS
jgi:hypothetical protein